MPRPLGQVLAELSPALRLPACSGGDRPSHPEPQLGLAAALSTLPPPTVGATQYNLGGGRGPGSHRALGL